MSALRLYLRRSKGDGEHQQFSLDTQRAGCGRFIDDLVQRGVIVTPNMRRVEYVDDDRAGDDFLGRAGLQRLVAESAKDDIVICRDQSRLGREALDTAMAIRTVVRDRGARLFYYANGQEVLFGGALDGAMVVMQGIGGQMELEAIRSRAREGAREAVRGGFIAGGACYGYRNERRAAEGGKAKTVAVVDQVEAEIIRRIFAEYVEGSGLSSIAKGLNEDGVASPCAGTKRGTRSWAPSAVREILRRERYVGVYVHGRIRIERKAGKKIRHKAEADQVMRIEIPEWRIVDDLTWRRAQGTIDDRAAVHAATGFVAGRPRGKHPLTGIARCGHCGGSLTLGYTRMGVRTVRVYVCSYHWKRGSAVCPVSVRQPQEEVEQLLAAHLLRVTLAPAVVAEVERLVREEAMQAFPAVEGVEALVAELGQLKAEQKRLARAVAMTDDVDELAAELRDRNRRIRALEDRLAVARQAPDQRAAMADALAKRALGLLARVREVLAASPEDAREAYLALFPAGLQFTPAAPVLSGTARQRRQVWQVAGVPGFGPTSIATPEGSVASLLQCLPPVAVTLRRLVA